MTVLPTKFGFTLPQRGVFFGVTTMDRMMALAAQVDANPLFDSIWVGDSLLAKPRPDSLTLLGGLGTATRRLTLGVGCMASFPVRDPIVFAYQWATLDLLSRGRMLLAACTGIVAGGASAREGALWEVADRERADRLAENIEICRKLWSEDRVSYKGRFRSFEDVTLAPRPVQQPCPIWIASNPRPVGLKPEVIDRALRRVARMADGWMTVNLFPGMFRANWAKLSACLAQEGRHLTAFPNIAYHNVNINPDRQAALEESKRFLDEYYGPVFSPSMVEAWTAAGTPTECVEHLRALKRDGARTVTLRITGWQQEEQYQRLVNEVLPKVDSV
jgi:alkanesulfonate monooxygenase SsuD/methylene tetrahydromethanopterin reductase-like flavin-dependent oxidoreductase (luciferase family)